LILYLDTSALVKLYANERSREEVQGAIREVRVVAISEIGYVEARSALARKEREGFFSKEDHNDAIEFLKRDFREVYLSRPVTGEVIARAGELVGKHALRAIDAVHLATALVLRDEASNLVMTGTSDEPQVLLMAFDRSLTEAARKEDFTQLT
jgi:predicted nucleic acid-binding protein